MSSSRICLMLLLLISSVAIVGCGPSDPRAAAISDLNKTNIQRVANLYKAIQMKNGASGFVGPADLQELKDFVNTMEDERLSNMGIDKSNVDAIFVSERDNEPFDIRFNVAGSQRGSQAAVVFEAKGVGGKKMVAFLNSRTEEVDEAEAKRLFEGESAGAPVRNEPKKN